VIEIPMSIKSRK